MSQDAVHEILMRFVFSGESPFGFDLGEDAVSHEEGKVELSLKEEQSALQTYEQLENAEESEDDLKSK